MSEENQATPPAAPNNDAEVQALKESVQKLEAKNRELIGKMQKKELIEPDEHESLKEIKRSWGWDEKTDKKGDSLSPENKKSLIKDSIK